MRLDVAAQSAARLSGRPKVPAISWGDARRAVLPPLVVLAVSLLAWEAFVRATGTPPYILPAPSAVLSDAVAHAGLYAGQGLITLGEAVGGFLIGAGGAVAAAIFMAYSRPLEQGLLPLAVVVKATPIVAVAPLLVIWFGFGYAPKVLISALLVFFPVLVNAIAGFRDVSLAQLELMRSVHASAWEVFLKLRLRSSLPYLFSACKVAVNLSVIGAVVGEWSGADSGLGRLILQASLSFHTLELFAGIGYLALMGILLTVLVGVVERRMLFWHPSTLIG